MQIFNKFKPSLLAICLFLCSLFLSQNSYAWGRKGHSLVAEIAFRYLDSTTKANVLKVLNGMTIEEAASWMDDQRSDHTYDYMKSWHYLNAEKGEDLIAAVKPNIVTILTSTINDLANVNNLPADQVKLKLLILFHLVGDLHQPLHVGYGTDKGGNDVQISFFGKGTNLHSVWDTQIIEYKNVTVEDCLAQYKFSQSELEQLLKTDVVGWAMQSRSYLNNVYAFQGHKMDDAYVNMNLPIIEKQLLNAGLRLAALLVEYFKDLKNFAPSTVTNSLDTKTPGLHINTSISAEDAINHIGETVSVCGKVYGTKLIERSETTFINMGAAFPNSPFTVVIFKSDRGNFKKAPEDIYDGKNICVTGLVKLYNGKAEIVVSKPEEIKIQ